MDAVGQNDFLGWAAAAGVAFDPRYPDSRRLCLHPPGDHARFWVRPPDPATWPHFAAAVLDGLDEWSDIYLWPRSGAWPSAAAASSLNERVLGVVLRGAGVPDGWAGAVRFADREADTVAAVVFAYLAFGWCSDDDLFLVPDHARQVAQTDHHDVVHVQCRTGPRVEAFVGHMAAAGYELPEDPPDWTFKRPAWMATGDD